MESLSSLERISCLNGRTEARWSSSPLSLSLQKVPIWLYVYTLHSRVAMKIFEDFGGMLNKAFIRGQEPVLIIHYTRPGTCINRPLH